MLAVLAAGLLVAAEKPTESAKSDQEIISEIEKLRGSVGVDEDKPGKPIVAVALYCTKVTDTWLSNLRALPTLEDLCLSNTKVTDAGLIHLSGMKQLQGLDLSFTKVTDAGLRHLTGLRDLEFLNLDGTKVTKKGLKMITKALPKCVVLDQAK
jgi:hypothetical protein